MVLSKNDILFAYHSAGTSVKPILRFRLAVRALPEQRKLNAFIPPAWPLNLWENLGFLPGDQLKR